MSRYRKQNRRGTTIFLWILLVISAIVLCVSGFFVLRELVFLPAENSGKNETLRAEVKLPAPQVPSKQEKPSTKSKVKGSDLSPLVNFEKLRAQNSDIIGWIQVDDTGIDYPVLQSNSSDPNYYLYRDYLKNDTKYGSVFLDSAAQIFDQNTSSQNLVLYGHNMNDGSMFAPVLKYGDLDFYRNHAVFRFDLSDRPGAWKVISVFKTNVQEHQGSVFPYTQHIFASDEKFLDFVQQVRVRSLIETDVTVNENDQLLTLSTCSYEFDDARTVLVARRVRDSEFISVDTKKASVNESPLYPDCWYREKGGSRPDVAESFREAVQRGEADWYDGALSLE